MSFGPLLASLLLAGLAGSLHCVGMCGPILLGFSQAFGRRRPSLARDFAAYHAGRIWTYALLGSLAGFAGGGLRHGAAIFGWQRPLSLLLASGVVVVGLLLLGAIPGLRLEGLASGCAVGRLRQLPVLSALLGGAGLLPRLLLGAVMGFLPCGLVYGMLAVVATLPSPLHAALAMLVFGLGTVPALSAVLWGSRLVPAGVRAHGTRLVAAGLVLVGVFMAFRTLWVHQG